MNNQSGSQHKSAASIGSVLVSDLSKKAAEEKAKAPSCQSQGMPKLGTGVRGI